MKAFKSVQNFAAKEQHVPDHQREWKRWKEGPKGAADEKVEEEEVAVVDEKKTEVQIEWKELVDMKGKKYWFDAASGKTTYEDPNKKLDDSSSSDETASSDDEIEESAEEVIEREKAIALQKAQKITLPPQQWEKRTHPLTRKAYWYCAELDSSVNTAPLEDPWRGVKDDQNRVYFWNPETNETRWS